MILLSNIPLQRRMAADRSFGAPQYLRGMVLCLFVFLLGAGPSPAQPPSNHNAPAANRPVGVFAHLDLDEAIAECKPGHKHSGKGPKTDHLSCIGKLVRTLTAPNYVSGIGLGLHWDDIQLQSIESYCQKNKHSCGYSCPSDINCDVAGAVIPTDFVVNDEDFFDWSYVFAVLNNLSSDATVLFIITPGVDSPAWLTSPSTGEIASCDSPVFGVPVSRSGTADPDCGTQTFYMLPEQKRAGSQPQPLPWNVTYQKAWANFLYQFKRSVGDPFSARLAGIAIAGPTTASTEMILPTTASGSYVDIPPVTFGQTAHLDADDAWTALIANRYGKSHPGILDSDQALINAWDTFIATYEGIFPDITLIVSPDGDQYMPEIGNLRVHDDNFLYKNLCSATETKSGVSCEAKTDVLSHFLDTSASQSKAVQVGGLTASSDLLPGKIGLPGVKWMAEKYGTFGGAEFDHPVTVQAYTVKEGCPSGQACCLEGKRCQYPLSFDNAMLNVLGNFFYNTLCGGIPGIWGGKMGPERLQYLLVDYKDIRYSADATNQYAGEFAYYLNSASIGLYYMADVASSSCSEAIKPP